MKAEVGDLVAWTANGRGIQLGIVYSHDINGNPMIIRQSDKGRQMVTRSSTMVLARCCTGCSSPDPRIADAMEWWTSFDPEVK